MRSIDGKGNSPVYLQIPCQFGKNHFSVEANTNFNSLNMAVSIAVRMDEINPSGSKMPHKREYAYSHFAPCNLEGNTDRYRLEQCKKLDEFNDSYNPTGYVHIAFALCFCTVANSLLTGILDRGMQSFQ